MTTCGKATLARVLSLALCLWLALPMTAAHAELPEGSVRTETSAATPLVYHFPERYRASVDLFEEKAGPAVDRLSRSLGIDPFPRVDVWIVPQVNDYFIYNELKDRAPEWAIGLSLSDQQTVVVAHDTEMAGGTMSELDKTFIHELAHVSIDVARDGHPVPRWFHEGFALMQANEWTPRRQEQLANAAATGALIRFDNLTRTFPAHHNVASLAYAQSFHFVRYIRRNHGSDVFARVIARLDADTSFADAVDSVTGKSLDALEGEWRGSIADGTSWLAILRSEFLLFFGATILLVVIWVLRRRRREEEIEAMEEDSDGWEYDRTRYPLPGDADDDS
jgi:hypothetical protein